VKAFFPIWSTFHPYFNEDIPISNCIGFGRHYCKSKLLRLPKRMASHKRLKL